MDIWLTVIVALLASIFALNIAAIQAIASICKQGGVTIRIIQDSPKTNEPTEPYVMTKEEAEALQQWNKDQAAIVESYKNFQQMYYGLNKEDSV